MSAEPTEGAVLPEGCVATVWVNFFENLSAESAVLAVSRGEIASSSGPPSTPVELRRGVVMRH